LSRLEVFGAVALAAALLGAAGALAQDERLIPGPGSTLTENKCNICHELQHIKRAKLSPGEWGDNLRNMKERGTPMTDDEMRVIHEYLATYYNRDRPAPAPSPDTLAAANGDPVRKLLEANGCSGCHSEEKRVVGPSFREVALKLKDDAGARSYLAARIRSGGQGAWGQIPMPANPGVTDADLERIVVWILGRN